MNALGYALFDTPLGACGIAWTDIGVSCLHLPEGSTLRMRAHMQRRFAQSSERRAPGCVGDAQARIQALLRGGTDDLRSIPVDLSAVPEFQRRVYAASRAIEVGQTRTYGEIAKQIGAPGAARAVGQALGRNPVAIIVPCHRVLAAGGRRWHFRDALSDWCFLVRITAVPNQFLVFANRNALSRAGWLSVMTLLMCSTRVCSGAHGHGILRLS